MAESTRARCILWQRVLIQSVLYDRDYSCRLWSCILQGVVSDGDSSQRVLIQGVHELWERQYTTPWASTSNRINRLVFIGEYKHNKLISLICDVCIYLVSVIC